MKIVIPMTGKGSRFLSVGYEKPKFLIRVDGAPVIEHLLATFPGEEDVIFICHPEHLENTDTEAVLRALKPKAQIVASDGARKGPVYAVSEAFKHIPDEEPVFVSYCDYAQSWDFEAFKKRVREEDFEGAVPSYTGFHPHLLHRNLYAGILAKDGTMKAIKEKHSFTENPEDSHHSAGSYYFKSGALMKRYFAELMELDMQLNGEYYVSSVYELMLRDNLKIFVPELAYFMQWGTPEDFEEYEAWSRRIHADLCKEKRVTDIPATREHLVTLPYTEDTPEFKKSYEYWKRYFEIQ